MGASQSARTVTVVNDETTGVIHISDSVVRRLKGEINGEPQQQQQQQQQQQRQETKPEPSPPPQQPPPPLAEPVPSQAPAPNQVFLIMYQHRYSFN